MRLLKYLFFKYQAWVWYAGQAKSEYGKIGSWIPETLMIMTYLTVKGIEIKTWYIPLAYIALMIVAALIGKFLVLVGVVKYTTKLSNEHNDEIQEILTLLKEKK